MPTMGDLRWEAKKLYRQCGQYTEEEVDLIADFIKVINHEV